MTERDIDVALWNAYYLGARAARHAAGLSPMEFDEFKRLARVATEIAAGEFTLRDPGASVAQAPDVGAFIMGMETGVIRADRELAEHIRKGLLAITETMGTDPDPPASPE